MRLPKFTAEHSIESPVGWFNGMIPAQGAEKIEMTAFDFGCLLGCGASTVLPCVVCGTNLACWATCAPSAIACITECF